MALLLSADDPPTCRSADDQRHIKCWPHRKVRSGSETGSLNSWKGEQDEVKLILGIFAKPIGIFIQAIIIINIPWTTTTTTLNRFHNKNLLLCHSRVNMVENPNPPSSIHDDQEGRNYDFLLPLVIPMLLLMLAMWQGTEREIPQRLCPDLIECRMNLWLLIIIVVWLWWDFVFIAIRALLHSILGTRQAERTVIHTGAGRYIIIPVPPPTPFDHHIIIIAHISIQWIVKFSGGGGTDWERNVRIPQSSPSN